MARLQRRSRHSLQRRLAHLAEVLAPCMKMSLGLQGTPPACLATTLACAMARWISASTCSGMACCGMEWCATEGICTSGRCAWGPAGDACAWSAAASVATCASVLLFSSGPQNQLHAAHHSVEQPALAVMRWSGRIHLLRLAIALSSLRAKVLPDTTQRTTGTCYDWRSVGWRVVNHDTHTPHRCRG